MGSDFVVVDQPFRGCVASVIQRQERMQVEELVSNFTVERFDMRVLDRLTWIDEVQIDLAFGSPAEHRVARQLRPVVES